MQEVAFCGGQTQLDVKFPIVRKAKRRRQERRVEGKTEGIRQREDCGGGVGHG